MARRLSKSTLTAVLVSAVALAVGAGGIAFAASQSGSSQVVKACASVKTGVVRIPVKGKPCATKGPKAKRERVVTWNRQGVPGRAGAAGVPGPVGPSGAAGPSGAPGGSLAYASGGRTSGANVNLAQTNGPIPFDEGQEKQGITTGQGTDWDNSSKDAFVIEKAGVYRISASVHLSTPAASWMMIRVLTTGGSAVASKSALQNSTDVRLDVVRHLDAGEKLWPVVIIPAQNSVELAEDDGNTFTIQQLS